MQAKVEESKVKFDPDYDLEAQAKEVIQNGRKWYHWVLPRDPFSQVPIILVSLGFLGVSGGAFIAGYYYFGGFLLVPTIGLQIPCLRIQCLVTKKQHKKDLKKVVTAATEMKINTESIKRATIEMEKMEKELSVLKAAAVQEERERAKKLKTKTQKIKKLTNKLDEAKASDQELVAEIKNLTEKHEKLFKMHQVLKNATDQLLNGMIQVEKVQDGAFNVEEYDEELEELESGTQKLDQENDELHSLLERMVNDSKTLSSTFQSLKEERDHLKGHVDELGVQNDELQGSLDRLKEQKKAIEQMNKNLRNNLEILKGFAGVQELLPILLQEGKKT